MSVLDDYAPDVQRRLKALKNLNKSHNHLEIKFHEEIHELEKKYLALYQPNYEKRSNIIAGKYEPTDNEAVYDSADEYENEEEREMIRSMRANLKLDDKKPAIESDVPMAGVPMFWLHAMQNYTRLANKIQPHDEQVLESLVDIKLSYLSPEQHGFKLDFVFLPNEFFTNTVLSKTYVLVPEVNQPELLFNHAEGTKIDWKNGKDVTVKTIKKKQRHKASGQVRVTTKTEPQESFFNFFSPPTPPPEDEETEEAEEENELVAQDYELGELFKDRIIPHAINYFTGEERDSEDDYDFGDEDLDMEDGDFEDDE